MSRKIIILLTTVILVNLSRTQAQTSIDFDDGYIPSNFRILNADEDFFGFDLFNDPDNAQNGEWCLEARFNEEDWVATPKLAPQDGNSTLSFWAKSYYPLGYNEQFDIYISEGEPIIEDFTVLYDSVKDAADTWIQVDVDLSAYIGQEVYVGIYYGRFPKMSTFYLDAFTGPFIQPETELAIGQKIGGEQNPQTGKAYTYEVRVDNTGTNNISNYSIQYKDNEGNFLGETNNLSINAGESQIIETNLSFNTLGHVEIQANIVLDDDYDASNNLSDLYKLDVQTENTVATYLGFVKELQQSWDCPFGVYYNTSACEEIVHAEKINSYGEIKGMKYFYDSKVAIENENIKVWMGTTQQNAMTDWIPADDLTLVYEGTVNFEENRQGEMYLEFNNTFNYESDNLVILTLRELNDYTTDSMKFITSWEWDPLYFNQKPINGTSQLDLNNVSSGGSVTAALSRMVLYFNVENAIHISGVVTDAQSSTPLSNVLVELEEYNINVTTNELGEYLIENIPFEEVNSNLNLSFSQYGYITHNETLNITQPGTTTLDMNMNTAPQHDLSGTVSFSDGGFAAGAIMKFLYRDTVLNKVVSANGTYSLPLCQDYLYSLSIDEVYYELYTEDIQLTGPLTKDIILQERSFPVSSVTAELGGNGAIVSWNKPAHGSDMGLNYDDGNLGAAVGYLPGSEGWSGNLIQTDFQGIIYRASIYSQAEALSTNDNRVTLDFMDLENNVIYRTPRFNLAGDDWVSIDIPNWVFDGPFYIMVHWFNDNTETNKLGLAAPTEAGNDVAYSYNTTTGLYKWSGAIEWMDECAAMIRLDAIVDDVATKKHITLGATNTSTDILPKGSKISGKTPGSAFMDENFINSKTTTSLSGFEVYRMKDMHIPSPGQWDLVATINDENTTSLEDENWNIYGTGFTIHYGVKAIYNNGATSGAIFSNGIYISSIEEHNMEVIKAFPSPAPEKVNITASEIIKELTIADMHGNIINQLHPMSKSYMLNVSDFKAGVYIISMIGDTNTGTVKVVVNR